MPRQPTGRGRGRPKGSGELGEQTRLTVRIPLALYERLTAFAEGRSYTRGTPQLAVCVREAVEEYLANNGQTKNTPLPQEENNRQTRNVPETVSAERRQTEHNPEAQRAATTATPPAPSPPPAPPRQRRQAQPD